MFHGCYSMNSVDVSSFNTSNVKNFYSMFEDCRNLQKLDLSNFDTSKAPQGQSYTIASHCDSLKELRISSTMGNLAKNAWKGLGSASSPCIIYAPEGFNFGVDTSRSYFIWKGGYFTLGSDVLLGDVNNDGEVNIADAMCIFSWLLGNKPCVFVQAAADFNQDGTITVSDGVAIIASILDTPQSYLSCPDNHHPHMIDLGLPSGTKWACCNVGASAPEGYGGYYAWGETEEKIEYYEGSYKYYQNGTYVDIGSDIAGTQYDVAHVKWGGSWVMPSNEQQNELRNNCAYEWTTLNGVNGGKFTSMINKASIFLPAAGCRRNDDLYNAGSFGGYESSTQDLDYSGGAYGCAFVLGSEYYDYDVSRFLGHSVRPVSK